MLTLDSFTNREHQGLVKSSYDQEFLDRLRAAEETAFDELVAREAPSIHRFVRHLLAAEADVDDLVQEVFVQAWQNLQGFRGAALPSTWLRKIALNCCRNHLRRQRLWRSIWGFLVRTTSLADSPQNGLATREYVLAALQQLSLTDREVLTLRFLEEQEIGEIASLLGVAHNTVEVRIHRAKQRLKSLLENQNE